MDSGLTSAIHDFSGGHELWLGELGLGLGLGVGFDDVIVDL